MHIKYNIALVFFRWKIQLKSAFEHNHYGNWLPFDLRYISIYKHTNLMNSVHHECIKMTNKTKQNEFIFVVRSPLSRWSINKIISLDWKSWWFLSRNQPTVDWFCFNTIWIVSERKRRDTYWLINHRKWLKIFLLFQEKILVM